MEAWSSTLVLLLNDQVSEDPLIKCSHAVKMLGPTGSERRSGW